MIIKNIDFSGDHKKICVPVVSRTVNELVQELMAVLALNPDVIEWRADYFDDDSFWEEALNVFKKHVSQVPLIYTLRDVKEGGIKAYTDQQQMKLLESVIASNVFDIIDIEWQASDVRLNHAFALREKKPFKIILSNHDFEQTPPLGEILRRLDEMKQKCADFVKVAYYANTELDALILLEASLAASKRVKTPQIALSMGALGTMTRIYGYQYGSVLTYAVGISPSAQGQMPIEKLRRIWKTLIE